MTDPAAYRVSPEPSPPSPVQAPPPEQRKPQRAQRRRADIHGTPSIMQAARPVQAGNAMKGIGSRIRVCVRKRPLSNKEIMRKETDVMAIVSRQKLNISEPK